MERWNGIREVDILTPHDCRMQSRFQSSISVGRQLGRAACQTRAVAEFLGALDDEDSDADCKVPNAISPVDPCSAWTAKANKRVQFGYGLNYLIDIANARRATIQPGQGQGCRLPLLSA
jgi:hypothetical protein